MNNGIYFLLVITTILFFMVNYVIYKIKITKYIKTKEISTKAFLIWFTIFNIWFIYFVIKHLVEKIWM